MSAQDYDPLDPGPSPATMALVGLGSLVVLVVSVSALRQTFKEAWEPPRSIRFDGFWEDPP